jgi:hypothetical protein
MSGAQFFIFDSFHHYCFATEKSHLLSINGIIHQNALYCFQSCAVEQCGNNVKLSQKLSVTELYIFGRLSFAELQGLAGNLENSGEKSAILSYRGLST